MKKKSYILSIVIIVLVIVGVFLGYEISKKNTKIVTTTGDKSSVNQPQPNSSASSSKPTNDNPQSNQNLNTGYANDTGGQNSSSSNQNNWIKSASGNITLEQPSANAVLSSGFTIVGQSNLSLVHFRLLDNSVGVIAQGTLNVVNGKFSGQINFTPHSSTGRLDVFSTNPDGSEANEINVYVKFQ